MKLDQWNACRHPFKMLPYAEAWESTRVVPMHARRLRHLAAAFLWHGLDRTGWNFTDHEQLLARTAAAALDFDMPGRPAPWSQLVRRWLRTAEPNYRAATAGYAGFTDSPGRAVAYLFRSRRAAGLEAVLTWTALRNPRERAESRFHPAGCDAPALAGLVRDVYRRPRGPVRGVWAPDFRDEWLTDTVVALASNIWAARDYSAMPILADALQDAGCTDEALLDHCRGPNHHCRGCWVLETVLWNRDPIEPPTGGYYPLPNVRGEYLVRCWGVVGVPDVYNVAFRRDPRDPNSEIGLFATADDLDDRFPGWRAVARPAPALVPAGAADGDVDV